MERQMGQEALLVGETLRGRRTAEVYRLVAVPSRELVKTRVFLKEHLTTGAFLAGYRMAAASLVRYQTVGVDPLVAVPPRELVKARVLP